MSSLDPIGASSPASIRRSRFSYRQFSQLTSFNIANPLRVIAHIDLDAFYAQCEMVRLGVPKNQPLAVQQWQGLIAVNYPARASGIGRMCTITEAKKLCPNLITQHVPTWREGDDKWAYRSDAAANIATDKVSLDPYRFESRKILALIKDALPRNLQRVEKASIDEVFLDLSAQIHSLMKERFPELSSPPPYDDPSEALPLPSVSALDWQADALVDLDEDQEALDPDWDDVAILTGSEIVRQIRARILEQLGYTCSAGLANTKLVSKLGSAFKKPNRQTVVRGRAVQAFLSGFQITKMRNLGGKLGDQVIAAFQTDAVKDLLEVPTDQLKSKLGDETGVWLYNTLRGIDISEVNSRTQIKSMLSAKSFRPSINNPDQAVKWLRIFVGDIYSRLVEEGVLENKRRPRTINLHYRHASQTRSRQNPIPQGKAIDEGLLLDLAKDLLRQVVAEGSVWPCSNLSLSVSGFEDGVKGNMGIDAFILRGDEAESVRSLTPDGRTGVAAGEPPVKKRRADGIQGFFAKQIPPDTTKKQYDEDSEGNGTERDTPDVDSAAVTPDADRLEDKRRQLSITSFMCSRCKAQFEDQELLQNHTDWHIARDLQDEERVKPTFVEKNPASHNMDAKGRPAAPKRGRGGKLEQGQSRLKFG